MLNSAAAVATICSAIIAFIGLTHQLKQSRRPSPRRRPSRLFRTELLLAICIVLFFFLGLAIPQAILPVFLLLIIVVYRNMPPSRGRTNYAMSVLAVTLAGLVGAYLSAYPVAANAGLPIAYSHKFRMLDIWHLLH